MPKTMISHSKLITSLAILVFTLYLSRNLITCEASDGNFIGFTIDLIHRDSPQSPIHNSSLSSSQRLANALNRSFNRFRRFQRTDQSPISELIRSPDDAEYLMKYSIGSPPFTTFGIADTGSDTSWTQCLPCQDCYKQNLPFFNPKNSSTYRTVPCSSKFCNSSTEFGCNKTTNKCEYFVAYGDSSTTHGDLAMDTLTFGTTEGNSTSFPGFIFGCGYKNQGKFSQGESGIIGLGTGKSSLISQLGPSIQGKFSYCMLPNSSNGTKSSKMHFGANAEVSGQGVVSTPLTTSDYYLLTLEGISIEDQQLGSSEPSSSSSSSNDSEVGIDMIIDSGTTVTFLPDVWYNNLEEAVKSRIKIPRLNNTLGGLNLCYSTRESVRFPDVVLHFKGADVRLKPDNVFVRTSEASLCLGFVPGEGLYIYGNVAQGNFLVGYDLMKKTVSFKPADCSSF